MSTGQADMGRADVEPAATDDVEPAATDDVEPAATDDVEPAATDDVEPAATDDVEPAATDDVEPAATDDVEPAGSPLPPEQLRAALEAILLIVDEPANSTVLAQVLGTPQPEVVEVLRSLREEYDESRRGFELREVAGGWRLYTRAQFAAHVERFVLEGQQARLTQAALETLAVVAYRQPVSRTRVSAVRGVNVDSVMRTLVSRGLVEEAGAEHESGALLYQTSPYFLERLGLRDLTDLPNLANFLPESTTIDQLEDELSGEG